MTAQRGPGATHAGPLASVYAATMSFARVESVQHEIQAHYPALRAIRTRKALERSALWAEDSAAR